MGKKDDDTAEAPPQQAGRGDHYVTEVNKGSLNRRSWQGRLNDMHARGYRLAHGSSRTATQSRCSSVEAERIPNPPPNLRIDREKSSQ
jgi:hypothetical protein